ncbi:hypothetical protein Clacol_008387 [Clathrus columnatus]|uniref:Uncharacterized protein n=1 Tax=Clathrus columnatus TaxID=1419009 RepID=A0AAV5AID4_9AGAM|nr:hypothetical protein Clacol_008387 [Clathrus columnatus]
MSTPINLSYLSSLPELNGTNWSDWLDQLEDYLTLIGYTLPTNTSLPISTTSGTPLPTGTLSYTKLEPIQGLGP